MFIRQVFHLPLRQTEGFMNSLARIMKATIAIPNFRRISKRSIELAKHVLSKAMEPGCLVIVDSTGLKVYGKDEWHQEKHDVPARRTWRKLHLAVDENHQILVCELTTPETGDPTAVPDLLAQIEADFEAFIADGAHDGDTQHDQHIHTIEQQGRIAWQGQTGYNLRNYIELAIQRYKRIFGNAMKGRALLQQKTEAWISASALYRIINLGMPVSVKI